MGDQDILSKSKSGDEQQPEAGSASSGAVGAGSNPLFDLSWRYAEIQSKKAVPELPPGICSEPGASTSSNDAAGGAKEVYAAKDDAGKGTAGNDVAGKSNRSEKPVMAHWEKARKWLEKPENVVNLIPDVAVLAATFREVTTFEKLILLARRAAGLERAVENATGSEQERALPATGEQARATFKIPLRLKDGPFKGAVIKSVRHEGGDLIIENTDGLWDNNQAVEARLRASGTQIYRYGEPAEIDDVTGVRTKIASINGTNVYENPQGGLQDTQNLVRLTVGNDGSQTFEFKPPDISPDMKMEVSRVAIIPGSDPGSFNYIFENPNGLQGRNTPTVRRVNVTHGENADVYEYDPPLKVSDMSVRKETRFGDKRIFENDDGLLGKKSEVKIYLNAKRSMELRLPIFSNLPVDRQGVINTFLKMKGTKELNLPVPTDLPTEPKLN